MLQALDVILAVLLKCLLFNLIFIALMALDSMVCHVLNNYLWNIQSNAYTYAWDVVSILYMNILGSNIDKYHWISLASVGGILPLFFDLYMLCIDCCSM